MALDTPRETDDRRARILATRQALGAHGLSVEVAESEPVLCVAGPRVIAIRCDHRAADNGALWLFDNDTGMPIAQADAQHLHELITWTKGELVARAGN